MDDRLSNFVNDWFRQMFDDVASSLLRRCVHVYNCTSYGVLVFGSDRRFLMTELQNPIETDWGSHLNATGTGYDDGRYGARVCINNFEIILCHKYQSY